MTSKNTTNKTTEEILNTSSAMIAEKNVTMMETENNIHIQKPKTMHNHSEKLSKENMVSIPLMEDYNKKSQC